MDYESLRPVISGLIGGAIAVLLLRKLAVLTVSPAARTGKGIDELVRENRPRVLASNVLFAAILVGGVMLYRSGYVERNDWRGLGLTFGCATLVPAVFLFLVSIGSGMQRVRESYAAYALSQRVPLWLLYGGFALGAVSLFAALGSFIFR